MSSLIKEDNNIHSEILTVIWLSFHFKSPQFRCLAFFTFFCLENKRRLNKEQRRKKRFSCISVGVDTQKPHFLSSQLQPEAAAESWRKLPSAAEVKPSRLQIEQLDFCPFSPRWKVRGRRRDDRPVQLGAVRQIRNFHLQLCLLGE